MLTLLPKHLTLHDLLIFQFIGLCNTIYKILAKVICARLKPILSNIIEPNRERSYKYGDMLII